MFWVAVFELHELSLKHPTSDNSVNGHMHFQYKQSEIY
jgi:hypothetical protein